MKMRTLFLVAVGTVVSLVFVYGCQQPVRTGDWVRPASPSLNTGPAGRSEDAPISIAGRDLAEEVRFLRKQVEVLKREKDERIKELQRLRGGVRTFTESVRDSFERYRPEIKDYFGGELYDRENLETQGGGAAD